MTTIDATLRGAVAGAGNDLTLTLDPALQGLPDTAHGGSVLALFDVLAAQSGRRTLRGHYHRRVPLGVPLSLRLAREADGLACRVADGAGAVLVEGGLAAGDAPAGGAVLVGAERAATRPGAGDARYWETRVTARDEAGRALATADITFVAVRGAARRLVTGLLAMNPPDVVRRVFPAYCA